MKNMIVGAVISSVLTTGFWFGILILFGLAAVTHDNDQAKRVNILLERYAKVCAISDAVDVLYSRYDADTHPTDSKYDSLLEEYLTFINEGKINQSRFIEAQTSLISLYLTSEDVFIDGTAIIDQANRNLDDAEDEFNDRLERLQRATQKGE